LNVARQFLEVVAKYDKDTPVMEDWNDFKTGDGYGVSSFFYCCTVYA
jgi:hypothetical protein